MPYRSYAHVLARATLSGERQRKGLLCVVAVVVRVALRVGLKCTCCLLGVHCLLVGYHVVVVVVMSSGFRSRDRKEAAEEREERRQVEAAVARLVSCVERGQPAGPEEGG